MVFLPKPGKKHFGSTLLPITLKITPNIISLLLLPIEKLLENLKCSTKSQGVSPWFFAKIGSKILSFNFASNHSENHPKHHFSALFTSR